MGIFRSEPMSKGTLVLPSEGARDFLEMIASHALVQFVDMNAQTLHRRYKRYVQRLEEMERILRFLYAQIEQHAAAAKEAVAAASGDSRRFASFSWSVEDSSECSSSDAEDDPRVAGNEEDAVALHFLSSSQQQPLQQQLLPRLLLWGTGSAGRHNSDGTGGDTSSGDGAAAAAVAPPSRYGAAAPGRSQGRPEGSREQRSLHVFDAGDRSSSSRSSSRSSACSGSRNTRLRRTAAADPTRSNGGGGSAEDDGGVFAAVQQEPHAAAAAHRSDREPRRSLRLPRSRPPVFQLDRVEEALNKLYTQFVRFSQNNDDLLRQRDAAVEECSLLLLAAQQLQPTSPAADDGAVYDSTATAASGRFGSKALLRSSDGSSLLAAAAPDGVGSAGGGRRRRQFPQRAAADDAFGECVAVEIRTMAFSSVAGVLRSVDQEKFTRALFRATRGNAYTYLQPADSGQLPVEHASTLEGKSLFVTYYQGGRSPSSAAYEKVMRLCAAFGVHCYNWPSTYEEACRRLADLEVQLADKAHALRGYEQYFLSEIAVLLEPVSTEEEDEEEEEDEYYSEAAGAAAAGRAGGDGRLLAAVSEEREAAAARSPMPTAANAAAEGGGFLWRGWWPGRQQPGSRQMGRGGEGGAAAATGAGRLGASSSTWKKRKRPKRRPLIEEWRLFCVKEKAIYVALNMFEDSGATLRAECWFPTYQEAKLRFLIAEQSSRSHATAFLLLQQPPWGGSWSSGGGEEERGSVDLRSSSACSYFFGAAAPQVAPTFFRLPPFLLPFQQLVDTYGIPRHRELNPAVFACVFFPFLFGVMYGDVGHGAALLAAAGALFSLNTKTSSKTVWAWKQKHGDSLRPLISARHMLFLMGFFATYAGFIYNEVLSLGVDFFGSRWRAEPGSGAAASAAEPAAASVGRAAALGEEMLPTGRRLQEAGNEGGTFHFAARGDKLLPASQGFPYPFGFDPVWKGATNELAVFNSFKMKFAVIVGFTQMLLGLVLHALNTVAAKDWVTFFWGAVPQLLLFVSLIGYVVFLIIFKWVTPAAAYKKPSLINVLIDMHMQPSLFAELPPELLMFDCQPVVQRVLRVVAYASVPCLLLGKPLWLYFKQRRKSAAEFLQPREGQLLLRSLSSSSSSSSPSDRAVLPQRGRTGESGQQNDGANFTPGFGGAGAAGRGRWQTEGREADAPPFFDEEAAMFSSRHSLESSSTAPAAAYPSWLASGGGPAAGGGAGGKGRRQGGGAGAVAGGNSNSSRVKKRSTRQLLLFDEDAARQDWTGVSEEVCEVQEPHEDGKKPHEQLGEVFIHQMIETIEFVLGTVSNTASYLRLWALSLAHQQLATVFFENTVGCAFTPGLGELQMVVRLLLLFPVFALITLFVMLCMDGLECFLHALRLQWVEFQSKFYKADGYPFEPLSFSRILRESKLQSSSSTSNSGTSSK